MTRSRKSRVVTFLGLGLAWWAGRPEAAAQKRPEIAINEILAANRATNSDEDAESSDWVELVNRGGSAVVLEGYYLSDDPLDPLKWRFPAVEIGPGEHLLVEFSGNDRLGPPP